MPTATATTRKRRTRKASATVKQPRKSASKVTPTPVQSAPVVVKQPVKTEPVVVKKEVESVEKVRRNLNQLDGFELALLPLIYLEGFAKLVLKIV